MKLRKKIASYVFAGGVVISTLAGCATTQMTNSEVMKVLEVENISMVQMNIIDGYKTSRCEGANEDENLRILAGIYAGTVDIKRTKDGYTANGFYSQYLHPKAMRRVVKEADINRDKIITSKESKDLRRKLFEENAK